MASGTRDHLLAASACVWVIQHRPHLLLHGSYSSQRGGWAMRLIEGANHRLVAALSIRGLLDAACALRPDCITQNANYSLDELARHIASQVPLLLQQGSRWFAYRDGSSPYNERVLMMEASYMLLLDDADLFSSLPVTIQDDNTQTYQPTQRCITVPAFLAAQSDVPAFLTYEHFLCHILPIPSDASMTLQPADHLWVSEYIVGCRRTERHRLTERNLDIPLWLREEGDHNPPFPYEILVPLALHTHVPLPPIGWDGSRPAEPLPVFIPRLFPNPHWIFDALDKATACSYIMRCSLAERIRCHTFGFEVMTLTEIDSLWPQIMELILTAQSQDQRQIQQSIQNIFEGTAVSGNSAVSQPYTPPVEAEPSGTAPSRPNPSLDFGVEGEAPTADFGGF